MTIVMNQNDNLLPSEMPSLEAQIVTLQQAIAAQEALRATLGDTMVDLTLSALQAQLDSLVQAQKATKRALNEASPEKVFARLQSYIPQKLVDKIRATGRIENERKQVTVVFADLSGFTALSERLDPEEVIEITNTVLKNWAEAVYECEGYIDKFIGDAIMAVWGAPIAHEDDPERALRAALSMRERLENINRHFENRLEQPLSFHIGINTGTAIAGSVGSDLRLSYTVMGDTVNTASRLESAAKSGQILVSRETYRLTAEAFAFQALDPITVKGKREPLAVFELLRAKINPGKSRGLKGLSSPLVGRDREVAQLAEVWQELQAKRGRIVIVSGEAGLGKSRLMAEWKTELKNRVNWLEGRCFSHTTALAYSPFLDLFRRFAGIRDEDSEETARSRLLAAIDSLFPGNIRARAIFVNLLAMRLSAEEKAAIAHLSPESLRQNLLALIEDLLTKLASERPTVFIIEDLHWADITSIEMVERLLFLTSKIPLAIIAVCRLHAEEPSGKFRRTVASKYAEHFTEISLVPLSEISSLELIEQLLATPELPEIVRQLIHSKADGNPFFVEEVIRSLIERGALMRNESGEGWTVTPLIESVIVPDTLQGVLMSRLDRLPDETKWLVQQASVIGRVFLYRVLRQMAENTFSVDANLTHLEREELIREKARHPEIEYIFKHALTQEVAYQSLLTPRRKELHRKVGEAMEVIFSERLSEFHSILGKHFWLGEDWEKAAQYLMEAGDDAANFYAYVEARLHYADAIEALSRLSDTVENRRRCVDAIVKLSEVSLYAEIWKEMKDRLTLAESLIEKLPHPLERSDILRKARVNSLIGWAYCLHNQIDEAINFCQQALAVAQPEGDAQLLANSADKIGTALLVQGHFSKSEAILSQAWAALEKSGIQSDWIATAGLLSMPLTARGNYTAALAIGQRALGNAIETNNLSGIVHIRMCLCAAHFLGGDMVRSLDANNIVMELVSQSGDRAFSYWAWGYNAWANSRLGNHAAAIESMTKLQEVCQSFGGQIIAEDWFAAADAEIALNADRLDEALTKAQKTIAYARSIGGIFAEGIAHRVLAQALWKKKQVWQEVEEHLTASLQLFEAGDARLEAARTHVIWGLMCGERGETEAAIAHLEKACAQFEASELTEELERSRTYQTALKNALSE